MRVDKIRRIAVVGAGLMGHGIAQEFALAGYEVHLHSRTDESLQKAMQNIQGNLERLVHVGLVTRERATSVTTRIHATTVFQETVDDVDVVIEAVSEDLELKKKIFQQLDGVCPERTILASTTSSLMPSEFASTTRRPERVLVAHFINPPYLIPLVEIVRGRETSDDTVTTMCDLLTKVGKRPVILQKEVSGFIVNRLQGALLREALWLVENGVASPQGVDIAIKTSIGRRWAAAGVFEVFDIAGWDVVWSIVPGLLPDLASSPEVSPVLKEKVEGGELGVKTGKGFYEWTPESAQALKQRIARTLANLEQWS